MSFFWQDAVKEGKLPGIRIKGERAPRLPAAPFDPEHVTWPESDWAPPAALPYVPPGAIVGIDLETRDPNLLSHGPGSAIRTATGDPSWGYVLGVALDWGNGSTYYPLAHPVDDPKHAPQVDPVHVWQWLEDHFKRSDLRWVGHNIQYDLDWCGAMVGYDHLPWDRAHCTQTAAILKNELERGFSLNATAERAGIAGKDQVFTQAAMAACGFKGDPRKHLWQFPARFVGPYAAQDITATRQLWLDGGPTARPLAFSMSGQLQQVYELERSQWEVLSAMRREGVPIDADAVEQLHAQWGKDEREAVQAVTDAAGRPVNVNAAKDMALLCDTLGLLYPHTEKGAPSFTKDWLKVQTHPVFRAVRTLRGLQKNKGTFLEGYFTDQVVNGRVHAEFRPLKNDEGGAISGRYSSSNPNLQNIPVRDPVFGPPLRRLLLPSHEPGWMWAAADYAQQEYRLIVHYAALGNLRGGVAAQQMYITDPTTDFHRMVAELANITRTNAKNLNFGMAYGMGEVKLCHSLGLPTEWVQKNGEMIEVAGPEGKAVLAAYHGNVPFVRELSDRCSRRASRLLPGEQYGEIVTFGGRHRRFPAGWSTHKAMNALIQGSAADMTKLAMVAVYRAVRGRAKLLVTVHDELGLAVPVGDTVTVGLIKSAMESAVVLSVPVLADVGTGANWGEAKE